jgi:hypothetical protein
MRARKNRPADGRTEIPSSRAPSEGGGYVSSEHSQGELMPRELADAEHRAAVERIRDRQPDSLVSVFTRLKARMETAAGHPLPKLDSALDKLRKKTKGA